MALMSGIDVPKLVTGKAAIAEIWERYVRDLKRRGSEFSGSYRTRGADIASCDEFCYSTEYIYWKSGNSQGENRYWNTFGVGQPSKLRDAFQVNIPKEGADGKTQGGFLMRGKEVFLLHRDSLRGGRKDGNHDLRDMVPEFVAAFDDDDGSENVGVLFPYLDASGRFHNEFLSNVAHAVKIVAKKLGRQ